MLNMSEIKQHLKAVDQTRQITKAMYLISTVKMRKAMQKHAQNAAYIEWLCKRIKDILTHDDRQTQHMFLAHREGKRTAYLVIAGDKGLAGAYNANIMKTAMGLLQKNKKEDCFLFTVGQVATHELNHKGYEVDVEFLHTAQNPQLYNARQIANEFIDLYSRDLIDQVIIIYTHMGKSSVQQVRVRKLLPVELSDFDDVELDDPFKGLFRYEPSRKEVLDTLVSQYVIGMIYATLVQAYACEQSSRMRAMDSATQNADKMLSHLNQDYRSARQASVTNEIIEVVSGTNAIRKGDEVAMPVEDGEIETHPDIEEEEKPMWEQEGHRNEGVVIDAGDGVVRIKGLPDCKYGELLEFSEDAFGMAFNLEEDIVGAILLTSVSDIKPGDTVIGSGRVVGVPVGEPLLGRIVNPLGQPLDGKGDLKCDGWRPIETPAPSIYERSKVDTPLQTGIMAIDSMIPIGRGQRELIIGDRQTGKSAIAIDTILNQKDTGVICIYVAIGQKVSSVAGITEVLEEHKALDYTIVVASTASESAPMQYVAPYAGCAMAEYFMDKGKDVLIVYDDLSKHAVAYRTMSLLLHRPPGREAYPGDVFYLHSRLLERAARLSEEKGGGSMTALPIVETMAGDISAYIPTNVISITDGQIFLESELFYSGVRPAVNVGLSVSRVGSSAQTQAMRKVSGQLRLELAQYREMAVFSQFSSELDKSTQQLLAHGARLTEMLKQAQYLPLSVAKQVVLLYIMGKSTLVSIPMDDVITFKDNFLEFIQSKNPDLLSGIEEKKTLDDQVQKQLDDLYEAYRQEHHYMDESAKTEQS